MRGWNTGAETFLFGEETMLFIIYNWLDDFYQHWFTRRKNFLKKLETKHYKFLILQTECNLIVLVESDIKHETFNKEIDF